MAKLLICDDEAGLRMVIKRYATFEGHEVVEAEDGAEAVGLMLTARGEEYDKVKCFEIGVDDYVVKPFSSKEIMLRINAILRRSARTVNAKTDTAQGNIVFEKEGFKADLTAYKVYIDGAQADMAPKEYDLLFFLIRNKNIAVPRVKILTEVWGFDYYGDDRTLDTHMKHARSDNPDRGI